MMQQMNLFNTSPEVAGFKLDYLEVWNWGTFDQKVYCMNTQGNNSLLTGANASGKSTLVDALLTLLVPLKRHDSTTNHRVWRRRATVQRSRTSLATMAISSRRVQRALPRLDCETKGHVRYFLHRFAMWTNVW